MNKQDVICEKNALNRFIVQSKNPLNLDQDDIDYPCEVFEELITNNSPYAFYLFQWVPYQKEAKGWRLKLFHDIKTFDGREILNVWPNGAYFGPFREDEIEYIRISKSQADGSTWIDPRPN